MFYLFLKLLLEIDNWLTIKLSNSKTRRLLDPFYTADIFIFENTRAKGLNAK